MIDLNKIICTGCTACASACPKEAIVMECNAEGFLYPVINKNVCVKCGLCVRVCDSRKERLHKQGPLDVYGAKARNNADRKESQSGGAFWVFAKQIIDDGGVVYGVRLDKEFVARHDRASTMEELASFRGSKYVQSDMKDIFRRVRDDLRAAYIVLFAGTPCQVAGLRSYLNKEYANLITIDLVCHGVPSPLVWKDYCEYQKPRHRGQSIEQVEFRDTRLAWGKHREKMIFDGVSFDYDIYASLFHSRLIIREECFNCEFANLNRVSDITCGDFWGIENINPSFNDELGVSCILVNSEKGRDLFSKTEHLLQFFRCNSADVAKGNPNLLRPSSYPKNREKFWSDYKHGVVYVIHRYSSVALTYKIKKFVYSVLKRIKLK